MIKIDIASKIEYEEFKNVIPESFKKLYNSSDTFVMFMKENDTLLGIGAARILDNCAVLEDVFVMSFDAELQFGLGKALLNLLDLNDIKDVYCNGFSNINLINRLGFKMVKNTDVLKFWGKNDLYYLNLENYFLAKSH